MFFKLFLLFAVMPIVEISLLIHVSDSIGGWNTVALVILTAFVGATLVKQQGMETLKAAQAELNQGAMPAQHIAEGLLLLIAGVLLITPGLITDAIGFAFTLPITRPLIAKWLLSKFTMVSVMGAQTQFHTHQNTSNHDREDIIEGEFTKKDD